MREKKKKKQESVFTPASVRLSKNITGEKKNGHQRRELTDRRVKAWTNNKSHSRRSRELSGAAIAMHYITFDLEGDLLALLLLVYTQMKTDIQESSTYFFFMHISRV